MNVGYPRKTIAVTQWMEKPLAMGVAGAALLFADA
jgi:hypothetical protein